VFSSFGWSAIGFPHFCFVEVGDRREIAIFIREQVVEAEIATHQGRADELVDVEDRVEAPCFDPVNQADE
jgi:hypothetical protein